MSPHTAWFLVGPTGVGKTAVGHHLARRRSAIVLSADAMAVYRGMDVGTAKPDTAMRAEVCYRGIDLIDPCDSFSVGAYLVHARCAAEEAAQQGRPLLVVGGTGLYVSALLRGLDSASPVNPERRAHWERVWRERGLDGLQRALQQLDAGALAGLADPQNPRRVIRALERAEAGHAPGATWRAPLSTPITGLRMDPDRLRERLRSRARQMFAAGILDEADRLRRQTRELSPTAAQAIGYAEAFGVLDRRLTVEEAVHRTAARTWQLARRQMTWFRRQLAVSWIEVDGSAAIEELAEQVSRQWEQHGPSALSF